MIRLRAFAAQAEAQARWARHRNSVRPAVTATSAQPWEFRQLDADVDLPHRKSRWAVYPRKPIAPAVPVSLLVDIYDGRPLILPVRLQRLDFPVAAVSSSEEDSFASVTLSASPACMVTAPGGPVASRPASRGDVRCVSPVSMIVSEPGVMSEFSSHTEADLEDKFSWLQPLPAPVLPLSTVLSLRRVESPSSYPAPAVPVISSTATSTVTSVPAVRPLIWARPAHTYAGFECAGILPNDFAGDASATGGPVASSWFGDSHTGGAGILR